jgi:hypothetical protein
VVTSLSIWPVGMDLAFCYVLEKATLANRIKSYCTGPLTKAEK